MGSVDVLGFETLWRIHSFGVTEPGGRRYTDGPRGTLGRSSHRRSINAGINTSRPPHSLIVSGRARAARKGSKMPTSSKPKKPGGRTVDLPSGPVSTGKGVSGGNAGGKGTGDPKGRYEGPGGTYGDPMPTLPGAPTSPKPTAPPYVPPSSPPTGGPTPQSAPVTPSPKPTPPSVTPSPKPSPKPIPSPPLPTPRPNPPQPVPPKPMPPPTSNPTAQSATTPALTAPKPPRFLGPPVRTKPPAPSEPPKDVVPPPSPSPITSTPPPTKTAAPRASRQTSPGTVRWRY